MAPSNINNYPQKYFLEGEACKHFGMKPRTLKRLLDDGKIIPGRLKVKGTNYYVIEPVEFHAWYSANILEPATNKNKFHNREPKQKNSSRGSSTSKNEKTSTLSISCGGLSHKDNLSVMGAQVVDRKAISA
jgi:hypothetical protein